MPGTGYPHSPAEDNYSVCRAQAIPILDWAEDETGRYLVRESALAQLTNRGKERALRFAGEGVFARVMVGSAWRKGY